jgi:MOSC domain
VCRLRADVHPICPSDEGIVRLMAVPASEYSQEDLVNTIRVLGPWWFTVTEAMQDPLGDQHIAALYREQHDVLVELASAVGLPAELFRISLDGEHELSLAISLLRKRWPDDARTHLEVAVDASIDLLHRLSLAVRAHTTMRGPSVGVVDGLFVSTGGVPKRAVERVDVGPRGIIGDRQATRRHHGRAWQALCLWSGEVVESLAAEGHPIIAGSAGENISIRGLDWTDAKPGVQLRIGEVLAEVSVYALPCSKNAQWFVNGDFERMHHRREQGISRLYASIIEPGAIATGDTVSVLS